MTALLPATYVTLKALGNSQLKYIGVDSLRLRAHGPFATNRLLENQFKNQLTLSKKKVHEVLIAHYYRLSVILWNLN
jgi:hypothetical protein